MLTCISKCTFVILTLTLYFTVANISSIGQHSLFNLTCRDIQDCLECLAYNCFWSFTNKENRCSHIPANRNEAWYKPGSDAAQCQNSTLTENPNNNLGSNFRQHDNWNNPVSLSLLLLLSVLLAANILYFIWKVSQKVVAKWKRQSGWRRDQFPLSEDDFRNNVERF